MSSRKSAGVAPEDAAASDHNVDRYPTLAAVMSEITRKIAAPGLEVERVEITCLANGEANCRWWAPRAEEWEIEHFPPGF